MKPLNPAITSRPTTIFTVMSALAAECGAINLGQGFPDTDGPRDVRQKAAEIALDGPNQYPPMPGSPELRQAVAAANARFYGLDVDWREQVLVTSGGTEALAAAAMAFLCPGDEAVVIEPAYDAYFEQIAMAGATARPVALSAGGPQPWRLDVEALATAFGPKTKAIFVNSPLNPVGRVFDEGELAAIAELCVRHDVIAICDEVYEHLTFDGARHVPLMTLPGMAERTVRIGSAGKTFSLTGWKVGYATGAAPLIRAMAQAHQYLTFTTPPNLQLAIAYGLGKDESYFTGLASDMQAKRDRLAAGLTSAGFDILPAEGTYFLTADISGLSGESDAEFCKTITREARVAAIPISAFYHPQSQPPRRYVRFCFCKQDAVLDEAAARLRAWTGR